MNAPRDLLAALLTLCAAVGLTLWAPAAWVRDTVVDREGFLQIARPLGAEETFQKDVSDAAVDGVLTQVNLPRPVVALIEPLLQDQAKHLTQSDAFAAISAGSMDDLHATILDPSGGTVRADLNPYVDELVEPVGDRIGRRIDIPEADALRLDIVTVPASPWPARAHALADASGWIGWASLACGIGALLVARRRGAIGVVLGALLVVGGLVLMLGSQGIGAAVPESVDQARIVGTLVRAYEMRLGRDMVVPSVALMGSGALALVVALVALGVSSARRAGQSLS